MRHALTTSHRALVLALATTGLAGLTSLAPAARAADAGSCARWAATGGDDGATGTRERPFRSLDKLVASLTAGQTGCLPGGQVYEAVQGNGIFRKSNGTAASPVTLTSGGSGAATVRGQLLADTATHDVVITGLVFAGTQTDAQGNPLLPKSTHVNLLGDRITLRGNDITNPYGICVNAGRINAFQTTDPGEPSDDIVIEGNRVHGCGMSPKLVFSDQDSGAHGIYLVNTRRARVVENLVHDNRYRGFQQWPTGSGTLVAHNLFVRNATQVNVGSALTDGQPWWSTGTTVRDNVMVAKTGYRPEKNQASIAFNYPQGSPTYGNTVTGNCIDAADPVLAGYAYVASDNASATASFVDSARGDFRMTAGSACAGKGPRSIQPATATAPVTRSVTTSSATCSAGAVSSALPTAARNPVSDWLWFRADLYRWTGTAWVLAEGGRSWHYGLVGPTGLTSTWLRYDDRAAATSIAFPGLQRGSYYAVVQTAVWNSDGATARTVQPVVGSASTTWCRA